MTGSEIAAHVYQVLSPLLLAAVTWVGAKLAQLIHARVKNEYLRGALVRLDDTVFAVVREVHQVAVEGIKAASADGRLTPEERAHIKHQAVSTIKSHLGPKGLKELAHVLGIKTEWADRVIATKVEAAVHDLKRARTLNGVNHGGGWGDVTPPSHG